MPAFDRTKRAPAMQVHLEVSASSGCRIVGLYAEVPSSVLLVSWRGCQPSGGLTTPWSCRVIQRTGRLRCNLQYSLSTSMASAGRGVVVWFGGLAAGRYKTC